jgi:hypothetical protein
VAAAIVLALVLVKYPYAPRAHAASPQPFSVYLIDEGKGQIIVRHSDDLNHPVATIPVGATPSGGAIAINPDATQAFVGNGFTNGTPAPGHAPDGSLSLLSTGTNSQIGFRNLRTGAGLRIVPEAVASAPDGRAVWVGGTDLDHSFIIRIDLTPGPQPPVIQQLGLGSQGSKAIAVGPDGTTVYVVGTDGVPVVRAVDATNLASIRGPLAISSTTKAVPPCSAAVTPDSSALWTRCAGTGTIVYRVHLPLTDPPAVDQVNLNQPNCDQGPLAITPDGQTVYAGCFGNVTAIDAKNPSQLTQISVGTNSFSPSGLAVTPDGRTLLVAGNNDTGTEGIIPIPVGGAKPLAPINLGSTDVAGIAITPDQGPSAALSASPAAAGQSTSLDASASTVRFGTITQYAFDFGDGTPPTAPQPGATISHVYANAGTYTAKVIETDSAGTSRPPPGCAATSAIAFAPCQVVFTGQTASRVGRPPATTTFVVPNGPTNPSNPTNPTTPTTPTTTGTATTTPSTPTISLNPTVGPPGTVVEVTGSGFSANTSITLAWQPGIGTTPARTDQSGDLHAWVLVLPHDDLTDLLGARKLVVQESPGVSAAFLVEVPPGEPGGGEALVLYRR